jgi:hypothetical protein
MYWRKGSKWVQFSPGRGVCGPLSKMSEVAKKSSRNMDRNTVIPYVQKTIKWLKESCSVAHKIEPSLFSCNQILE